MRSTCSLLMEKKTRGNGREGGERRKDSKSGMREDEENFELEDEDVKALHDENVNVGFNKSLITGYLVQIK